MRRFFFRILDIRKNKPPVSVKYSTIFTFCVPQKCTIYTLEIKKAEQQNRKITKKKIMTTLCSSWISTILQINQTSTITIVQTTVWFFGKKKRKENNSHQKSKNPDFKTWKQNEKNPLKRAVMIKKLKPHMVTGQFRNQSCQLSRVQLINRGVSRLHVWLRPQHPTMPLNTKFRGAETLGVTFLCQSIWAFTTKMGAIRLKNRKQANQNKTDLPTSIFRAEALTWCEPRLYQDKRPTPSEEDEH